MNRNEELVEAQRALAEARAELVVANEKLAAAHLDHGDWDRLSAELGEQLRQTRERLDAIEASTTWRVSQGLLTPYRVVRRVLGR